MVLESLALRNFKNHQNIDLNFGDGFHFIVGLNGIGKTNILDAIYYCSMLKSFFQNTDKSLINNNADFFRIEAQFSEDSQKIKFESKYSAHIKESKWNDLIIENAISHLGRIPIVFISPDDAFYFFNESEERRKFLNQTIIQIDPVYTQHIINYNKALKLRNALLKKYEFNSSNQILIESYDRILISSGRFIAQKRNSIVEQIATILVKCISELSDSRQASTLVYKTQVDSNYEELLIKSRDRDIYTQRTNVGIHKDQLESNLDGQSLKHYGSQGQLKTFILALRIAQFKLIRELTSKTPIVLLDDIFAKLDSSRVNNLLSVLQQENLSQCLITDTHIDRVLELQRRLDIESHIIELKEV